MFNLNQLYFEELKKKKRMECNCKTEEKGIKVRAVTNTEEQDHQLPQNTTDLQSI